MFVERNRVELVAFRPLGFAQTEGLERFQRGSGCFLDRRIKFLRKPATLPTCRADLKPPCPLLPARALSCPPETIRVPGCRRSDNSQHSRRPHTGFRWC
jgi:hypothetical protein